jgi:membrane protein
MSKFLDHITNEQRRYYLTKMKEEPWHKRWFYAIICFASIFITEFDSLRLFTRAASGTYTTMLALIPFMVVGGSLIITFNNEVTTASLVAKIHEFVIPMAGETIAQFLSESLTRTLELGLGPVGVISLMVTSVMLFVHIEDAFNDIWHVAKPRAFYLRILLFYAVVTLGPVLFSFSIFQAAQLFSNALMTGFLWNLMIEISVLTAVCFIVFKFLPNTHVQIKPALLSAVIAAIMLEGARFAFSLYMSFAFGSTYSILYGALGIIPVVLLWLYISWIMMLGAVCASYCIQNKNALLLRKFYDARSGDKAAWVFIGAYAPLEILAAIIRNSCKGKAPLTAETLAVECIYPVQAIEAILARLQKIDVVKKVEGEQAAAYFIAKPLDTILIKDIMKTFDESSQRIQEHTKLEALITQLIAAQENIWTNNNVNILREDGVVLKDVSTDMTEMNLNLSEE